MKMTHEQLGEWIAQNPTIHSAKVNGDVETILAEAKYVLQDDTITPEDVTVAAKAYSAAVQAAKDAHAAKMAAGAVQSSSQAEG